MRQLAQFEINTIAGGANCIDMHILQNIKDQAWNDAAKYVVFGDGLLMCAAYGVATALAAQPIGLGLAAAAAVGVIAAPYFAIAGYTGSNAWKIINN